MPEQPSNEQYSPLALLGVVLASLLLFAAFFLGFLVAPMAVLLLFYVAFSAVDRSRRQPKRGVADAPRDGATGAVSAEERLAHESTLRRAERDRQHDDAARIALQTSRPDGE